MSHLTLTDRGAPCSRTAFRDGGYYSGCAMGSTKYEKMVEYLDWANCQKDALCSKNGTGNAWKLLIFGGGLLGQAGCGLLDAATWGVTAGCHAVVAGATSWGMHAVDGDLSVNAEDALTAAAAGLLSGMGKLQAARNAERARPAVFTSPDPLVGGPATSIEAEVPGSVASVNSGLLMSNGLTREVDIVLTNGVVVQVKSGAARGLTGQILDTALTTGRTVVGYAPDIPLAAWTSAANQGVAIARTASSSDQCTIDAAA